ncbi:CDP-alcohol phosphatidyltransferase family protein [Candidatus Leptofilum sp.]|uniref:CDP-alcohol phosphatidyltransferase family protein n=1 Tax=Candidatus Leptofilum sp. TaxID=3241576 RepID=UPI003B5CCDFD
MFDERMRLVKDTVFNPVAELVQVVPPWLFSVMGLIAGIGAALAAWQQSYLLAVLLWWLNRILDGLDGAVARVSDSQSDFGGYLDIIIDYVVYAAVPIGLAFGQMETAVTYALIFLLSTFYVNGASWMYLAAILEKRSHQPTHRLTSVVMPAGLVGGTETIVFYSAFLIFPSVLLWLFSLMGLLVVITIVQRLVWASRHLQ